MPNSIIGLHVANARSLPRGPSSTSFGEVSELCHPYRTFSKLDKADLVFDFIRSETLLMTAIQANVRFDEVALLH
jgi:hypothetical protein